ncbi:hypothetical protein DFQ30_006862 [Apophysomyces sp. BC1015]|nr:hypothetical protein DFQ30_006862 [Apophysomyces sp. BC1015]KAG0176251.1 hypothetical protein DFQ29_006372 [Apophysomyces sp. BC1021]
MSSSVILVVEVSSAYGENENGKTSLGRHKAIFGMLAMLRTLVDRVKYAKLETFLENKDPLRSCSWL